MGGVARGFRGSSCGRLCRHERLAGNALATRGRWILWLRHNGRRGGVAVDGAAVDHEDGGLAAIWTHLSPVRCQTSVKRRVMGLPAMGPLAMTTTS